MKKTNQTEKQIAALLEKAGSTSDNNNPTIVVLQDQGEMTIPEAYGFFIREATSPQGCDDRNEPGAWAYSDGEEENQIHIWMMDDDPDTRKEARTTDQGATRPDPNKETPQDAAARFWKRIKDGQGETDGAEIETWLQENTPEGDHRRETRSAILAGAEPMNHPTLTPRFTEQDLRDILGDTQKYLLAAWKRAETAEEIKGDNAEKDQVNPETGNTWETDYESEIKERERIEEELEKAEEKEQEAREAQAAAEAERDQARQDHERTLDRLTRAEIRAAELEKEIWEAKERLGQAEKRHATTKSLLADAHQAIQDRNQTIDSLRHANDNLRKELDQAYENQMDPQTGGPMEEALKATRENLAYLESLRLSAINVIDQQKEAEKGLIAQRDRMLTLIMPALKNGYVAEADLREIYENDEITAAKLRADIPLTQEEKHEIAEWIEATVEACRDHFVNKWEKPGSSLDDKAKHEDDQTPPAQAEIDQALVEGDEARYTRRASDGHQGHPDDPTMPGWMK